MSSSGAASVSYSEVTIEESSIPPWGSCYRRRGNTVLLRDSSGSQPCIRCFHLTLKTPNVIQIYTEGNLDSLPYSSSPLSPDYTSQTFTSLLFSACLTDVIHPVLVVLLHNFMCGSNLLVFLSLPSHLFFSPSLPSLSSSQVSAVVIQLKQLLEPSARVNGMSVKANTKKFFYSVSITVQIVLPLPVSSSLSPFKALIAHSSVSLSTDSVCLCLSLSLPV